MPLAIRRAGRRAGPGRTGLVAGPLESAAMIADRGVPVWDADSAERRAYRAGGRENFRRRFDTAQFLPFDYSE